MSVIDRELSYRSQADVATFHDFTETWTVTTDRASDDDITILRRYQDWRIGKRHPSKPGFYISDLRLDRGEDDIYAWEVVLSFTDDWPDEPDPRKRPATYTLRSTTVPYVELFDADGKPYQNSAGEYFTDLPTKNLPAWKINIFKNIPRQWPEWIKTAPEVVNSTEIKLAGTKWPKETLKTSDLDIGLVQRESEFEFCELVLSVDYHPRTWVQKIPNRGLYEKVPDIFSGVLVGWEKRRITHADGEKVEDPVWLDKQGSAIRETKYIDEDTGLAIYRGELKTNLNPDELVFIERWAQKRVDFSTMSIK